MKTIKLTDNITFGIEPIKAHLRLIVLNKQEEIACRKVKISEINKFLNEANAPFFKGRLQLSIQEDQLKIFVKGIVMGVISKVAFTDLLPEK